MGKRLAGAKKGIDWRARISVNPGVCHGTPCFRGTRVMASVDTPKPASCGHPKTGQSSAARSSSVY